MSEADLRNAIRGALAQYDDEVEAAIRRELAEPFELGHSGRLQFEVDPDSSSIHLVQTENGIFDGDPFFEVVFPLAEGDWVVESDLVILFAGELFPWFADRWSAADGPRQYTPAYMYYHGGLHQPRYDLEQRRWCEVEEVWPD